MASFIKQIEHLKVQLEAIKLATNEFSDGNCIGKGGFGDVYKGDLFHHKGKTTVALKRLNRAFGQGDPEFWKEIMMLFFYKHQNIVSLLGYCDDHDEKILVYEYVQKGSLDLYLDSNDLSWIRRLKICIGAARGLAYLHSPTGNQLRVLHRDIKSSNILLDENWDAKISDFGLSKFGPANQQFTFLVSNAVGTVGYCDPLYVETGLLTKESDVYSFGVVLFEVLCGRLSIGNNNNKHRPLTGLARRCYEENKLQEIIHGNLKDEINPKSLEIFTKIAYQCLKRDREERPLMTEIVEALVNALNYQDATISIMRNKRIDFGDSGGGQLATMKIPLGLLRVRIKRAVNLAIGDTYIVVKMGKQKLKTNVVKKDVNPVWNADLTFAFYDLELPITLTVYDHKLIMADEKLGEAEYYLEPFLKCLKRNLEGMPSNTVINRLNPSTSNCLAKESCITWRDNTLVQDLCLRLQHMGRAEAEIEIRWIHIPGSK